MWYAVFAIRMRAAGQIPACGRFNFTEASRDFLQGLQDAGGILLGPVLVDRLGARGFRRASLQPSLRGGRVHHDAGSRDITVGQLGHGKGCSSSPVAGQPCIRRPRGVHDGLALAPVHAAPAEDLPLHRRGDVQMGPGYSQDLILPFPVLLPPR